VDKSKDRFLVYRDIYKYVDVHFQNAKERARSWKRILLIDANKELIGKNPEFGVYTTIQMFKYSIKERGEVHYAPIYFDLDSETDVEKAIRETEKIANLFYSIGIGKEHVRMWFSGKKGTHICISPEVFGIRPHSELTYQIKCASMRVREILGLETIDDKVYSRPRMWRLPDSMHLSSGLYAVELSIEDIKKGLDHIKKIAKKPRGALYEEYEYQNIQPEKYLELWWQQFVDEYENRKDLGRSRPKNILNKPLDEDDPICMKHVMAKGLPREGTRNKAVLVMASYYKDIGRTRQETEDILVKWTENIPEKAGTSQRERVADTRGVVRAVYQGKVKDGKLESPYHFSCAYIRSLGKGAGSRESIPCNWGECKVVKQEDQETEKPIELELYEASRACYEKKKVRFEAMVSGKDNEPYIVPVHFVLKCPVEKPCEGCPAQAKGGRIEYRVKEGSDKYLEMIAISSGELKGFLKRFLGVPSGCRKHFIEHLEKENVTRVTMIPRIHLRRETISQEMAYVVRVGFFVGDDQLIESNKEYGIEAYLMPNPKNQYAVHLFHKADPLKSRIEGFEITEEMKADLRKFQGGDVKKKFAEIHKDLEQNITKIWGREKVSIAIDLTYHSVISFMFNEEFIQRGWLNVLIVGDSGQAKTALSERMMQHYELGDIVGGETASRTGLLYNIQETQNKWQLQWGMIPLNDKRLVFIDEFTGMKPRDIEEMSRMRESGILEVKRVQSATTTARTRLLFLSNTKDGKMLAEYQFGVDAILKLLPHKEDIRRFDLAITVASDEVPHEEINIKHDSTVPHIYTSESCRNLLLWAWSRKLEDIEFEDGVEQKILDVASFFSNNYVSTIPLVEPADMRIKIARMAVAVAVRLFSTDDEAKKVIVKEGHVEFIMEYLDNVYSEDSMGYRMMSRIFIKSKKNAKENHDNIVSEIKSYNTWRELVDILIEQDVFQPRELLYQWEDDEKIVKDLIKFLTKHRMIRSVSRGYKKMEPFVKILRELQDVSHEDPEKLIKVEYPDTENLPEEPPF